MQRLIGVWAASMYWLLAVAAAKMAVPAWRPERERHSRQENGLISSLFAVVTRALDKIRCY